MSEAPTASTETMEFKSELRQILHLITHSLYSNKEIFLRELISNASDAINKIRFNSINNSDLLDGDTEWKIKLIVDKDKNTLTVSDNGTGMSRETIIDQLGTIAKSGTRAFLETLRQADEASRPELIGQFGVGFYSSFMVADRVTVVSRLAGDPKDQGVRWVSAGEGEFTIKSVGKENHGTDVTLHLKEDEKEFLEEWRLRQVVKEFSDFIEYPVVMDVERHEPVEGVDDKEDDKTEAVVREETLNSMKALWLRSKDEIEEDEYNAFYRQISHDYGDPAKVIHYTAEGLTEFKVLLFIPAKRPFDMMFGDPKVGPRLYVQRVQIMENCEELLPPYLRFIKGVVDCADLPLNVSREILQQNPILDRIRKNIVKRIFTVLEEMKKDEFDKYVAFYRELGLILKEGMAQDFENRDTLTSLAVYESMNTEAGKYVSMDEYVDQMPPDQEEIYYLIGEHRGMLERTPYLEVFRDRGWNVLFMTDPIDEFVMSSVDEYREKKYKAADKGDIAADETDKAKAEDDEKNFKALIESLKGKIPEVQDIRLSTRLKDSASCLVADEGAMSAHMERLMQRMGEGGGQTSKRILELNAGHPVVQGLQKLHDSDGEDARVESIGRLLYEQAVVAEGSKLDDPVGFAGRINDLLVKELIRI
ncbi:MAG: molecular chaperone HtpG [Gemmatimonadetes bacterium]|nr:molecular chaperone HtpG [Gemmatimonadota bacterium]MYH19949.1 molecular chaperone HtpG [Gemmatimonadota bacterium]